MSIPTSQRAPYQPTTSARPGGETRPRSSAPTNGGALEVHRRLRTIEFECTAFLRESSGRPALTGPGSLLADLLQYQRGELEEGGIGTIPPRLEKHGSLELAGGPFDDILGRPDEWYVTAEVRF